MILPVLLDLFGLSFLLHAAIFLFLVATNLALLCKRRLVRNPLADLLFHLVASRGGYLTGHGLAFGLWSLFACYGGFRD